MLDGVGAPAKREELAVEHATAGLAIRRRQRSPGPGVAESERMQRRGGTGDADGVKRKMIIFGR